MRYSRFSLIKNRIVYMLCVSMILTMISLSGCENKEVSESTHPRKINYFSEEQLLFINSFAEQNNAIFIYFNEYVVHNTYSLDLENMLYVNEQRLVALPCELTDVSRKGDNYYLMAENVGFSPKMKYVFECNKDIAEKALELEDHQAFVAIASVTDVNQALLGLIIDESMNSESIISVDLEEEVFMIRGQCSTIIGVPGMYCEGLFDVKN